MSSKKPWLLPVLLVVSAIGQLFAYNVTIGSASVAPGNAVQVPLLLDDASNVATVRIQVNYDPQLWSLTDLTNRPGTLGSAFGLNYENKDGVVVVILYRQEAVISGAGELASLTFVANCGAEADMESSLTLAEVELGGDTGKDLSWTSPVSVANGLLQIKADNTADSDSDGLPDSWEELHFGNATIADPDAMCANGVNSLKDAYIAGLDPNNPESRFEVSLFSRNLLDWNSVSGRVYSVYWTTNLLTEFQCIESNILWTRSCVTNRSDAPSGFYKLKVRLAP